MNRIYRSIWNDRTGTFVATSENAKCAGKKSSPGATTTTGSVRFALKGLAVSLMLAFGTNVYALPTGGTVSAGNASINGAAGQMTIGQSSQNVAINWQSFSIGQGEAVRFVQPNSNSVALNRVLGSDPSSILGSLSANGKVFLVNPNGILFGKGASVNVGGLVASTLSITDNDFMAGSYKFSGAGKGTVANQGSINADGGYVALLGANVSNQGVISAKLGTVALAAGNAVTLDLAGDGLLNITVNQGAVNALVQNGGLILADGGQVVLTAQAAGNLLQSAVNNTGVIQAQTVENHNGTIRLLGDMQSGSANVSGTLDASAPNGGNGGFIETSAAHVKVADNAIITTQSAQGKSGTWLIDPVDFTVAAGGDISGVTLSDNLVRTDVSILSSSGTTGVNGDVNVNEAVTWTAATTLTLNAVRNVNVNAAISPTNGSLVMIAGTDVNMAAAITAVRGNVTATAGRDINISAAVTTTDGNFTACCGRDINISAAMTTTRGNVILNAGSDGTGSGLVGGTVTFASGTPKYAVTGPGAAVSIYYTPTSYTTPTDYSGNFTLVTATLNAYMNLYLQANNKVYDGNTTATLSFKGNPSGVTLVPGSATFADKNVAANIAVTYNGYTLGGADAGRFAFWAACGAVAGSGVTSAAITPAPLKVTASNATKIYGQTPTLTAFTTTALVNGETVGSITETSPGRVATAGVASSPYTIMPSDATGGTFIPTNYYISYAPGALAVTPAPLKVTASNATKIYGETPTLTAFTTTALVNGETVGSVTETSPGTPATAKVVGSPYAIMPSDATGGTFIPTNYFISYAPGALAVTPAPLKVTASNATKIYGETPTLTAFTTTALVNGETVGSVTETSPGAAVTASVGGSPYAITPSSAAGGTFIPTNYTIAYVNGELTVLPQVHSPVVVPPMIPVIVPGETTGTTLTVVQAATPPQLLAFVPAAVPVETPAVVREQTPIVAPPEAPPKIYEAPHRPRKQDRN